MAINKLSFIKRLNPAYFAMVMGTGIISIDALALKYILLSNILFYLDLLFYVILFIFLFIRIIIYFNDFLNDLKDHSVMFGYFTFVAGSGTLGARALLSHYNYIAGSLLIITIISWIIINYFIWPDLFLNNNAKDINSTFNGGWFLGTVGTEATSIISAGGYILYHNVNLLLFSLLFWSIGLVIYIIFTVLSVYRLGFYNTNTDTIPPTYWIALGAGAITTFAGFNLLSDAKSISFISYYSPFISGFSTLLWGWETWWYPVILILGIWRFGVKRFTLKYDPLMWSSVFVAGMYTRATIAVQTVFKLEFNAYLIDITFWGAFILWLFVFINMILYPRAR